MPAPAASSPAITRGDPVADLIDERSLSRLQILVVGMMAAILVLEGLSLQMLSYATPAILADWQVTELEFSPAVGLTKFGMAAGALIGAKFGDWWGRKPLLVGTTFLFSIATVSCAAAGDVPTLAALRLVEGAAFGACFPNAAALVAEWMPRRARSQAIGIMTAGIPVGGMLGAVIAMIVIERWGWQGCFLIGGFLPMALGFLVLWSMPESPSWTARRAKAGLSALLVRAWPKEDSSWVVPPAPDVQKNGVTKAGRILTKANARTNIALWLCFFMNGFAVNGLILWGTTALTGMGLDLKVAIGLGVPYNIASLAFTLGASFVAARFGTRIVVLTLAATTVVALAMSAVLGLSETPSTIGIGALYIAAGGFMGGVQALLVVLAAHAYPTESRSTGVGACSTVGRVSGIISGFAGGAVLSTVSPALFFAALAGAAVFLVVGAMLTDRHMPARSPGIGTS